MHNAATCVNIRSWFRGKSMATIGDYWFQVPGTCAAHTCTHVHTPLAERSVCMHQKAYSSQFMCVSVCVSVCLWLRFVKGHQKPSTSECCTGTVWQYFKLSLWCIFDVHPKWIELNAHYMCNDCVHMAQQVSRFKVNSGEHGCLYTIAKHYTALSNLHKLTRTMLEGCSEVSR